MGAGRNLGAAALLAIAASCGPRHAPGAPATVVVVDDAQRGPGLEQFNFIGHWERIRGRRDGRAAGTSTRSPHPGDSFAIAFRGYRFRLYGVSGPNGGRGILDLDNNGTATTLDFRSPRKRTHVLLYTSPVLAEGLHGIAVIVDAPRLHAPRAYVNIDSIEIDTR
ncbi:MAG: hypothetical protein ABI186_00720 [Candidatus Elarobacter sp.]